MEVLYALIAKILMNVMMIDIRKEWQPIATSLRKARREHMRKAHEEWELF